MLECEVHVVTVGRELGVNWWADTFSRAGLCKPRVTILGTVTSGQAETVLVSTVDEDPNRPVIVWNIDTAIRPGAIIKPFGGNSLLCFPSQKANLSYALIEDGDQVVDVAEKVVISPWATAGLYAFESLRDFRRAYEETYNESNADKETYVAPLYRSLIESSRVSAVRVGSSDVVPLGTPKDLEDAATSSWISQIARDGLPW